MIAPPAARVAMLVCLTLPACALAARLSASVHGGDGKPLPNAVVVAAPEDGRLPPLTKTTEVVDQIDKEFVPYVKAVRAGSYVQFPNKDNIRHHVYSFSPPKKFELPLYSGTPAVPVLFDKPGIVKLGCNIHDWMLGYIYVAETPYFGKSARDGRVEVDQLPPGRYQVRVWHPLMQGSETATVQRVELRDETPTRVEWTLKLNPEYRPRRTPLPGEPGYR
ncbi:MAG TPA: methylamine utilization protein [Burkholderiales bacterium]|nr:methylamine utilization protein [Burkholderiales bacterium]